MILLQNWRQHFEGKEETFSSVATLIEFPQQSQMDYSVSDFMASHAFSKNRICATKHYTHCTGRAGRTVQLLRGVLLFLWQCGHGGEQWGPWTGVGENKRSLSGARGSTGLLWVMITLLKGRSLQEGFLLFLELQDHAHIKTQIHVCYAWVDRINVEGNPSFLSISTLAADL